MKRTLWLVALSVLLWLAECNRDLTTNVITKDERPASNYAVCRNSNGLSQPAWSVDGNNIAFVSKSRMTRIYKLRQYIYNPDSAPELEPTQRLPLDIIDGQVLAVSPNGEYVLYKTRNWPTTSREQQTCFMYSAAQGASIPITQVFPQDAELVKWTRDGRFICYVSPRYYVNKKISVMTLEGLPVVDFSLDSTRNICDYSITADMQKVVWSGQTVNQQHYKIWTSSLTGGQTLLFASDSINYYTPAWSPDGNAIAFYASNYKAHTLKLQIYSFVTNKIVNASVAEGYDFFTDSPLEWSDDGQKLYFFGFRPETGLEKTSNSSVPALWSVSLTNNRIDLIGVDVDFGNEFVGFFPDGEFYYSANSYVNSIYNYSVQEKKFTCLYQGNGDDISSPAWSPDGNYLVCSLNNKLVKISVADGTAQDLGINDPNVQYRPVWSPDGSLIAFFTYNYEIFTVSVANGQVKKLQTDYTALAAPVWSADGKKLACSCIMENLPDSLIVFNYSEGKLDRLKAWPGYYSGLCWSAEHPVYGSYILFNAGTYDNDGINSDEIHARNFKTGREISLLGKDALLYHFKNGLIDACWAPDGESIAWTQTEYYSHTYTLNIANVVEFMQ